MEEGDPLIVWSQLTQGLRRARYLRNDANGDLVFQYADDSVHGFDSTLYTRRYKNEGILWMRGDDLDSPAAHALEVAFHPVYR